MFRIAEKTSTNRTPERMKAINKRILLPFFLLLTLAARADYTVSGYVTDAKTGESLIGVSIYSFD